jgi:hypothetical protein
MQTKISQRPTTQKMIDSLVEQVQNHFKQDKDAYVIHLVKPKRATVKELSKQLSERKYPHTFLYKKNDTDTIVFTVKHPY